MLIAFPLFMVAIAIWVLEAYFGTLSGDLTRIGRLDENDFGWRLQQPAIPAGLLKSYPLNEADVLVIGDSFSYGLVWQSRLIQAGFRPATLRWDVFKPCSIGPNMGEVIRRAGYNGRYLVIENVEHGLQHRMEASCKLDELPRTSAYTTSPPPASPPTGHASLFSNREPLGGDWVIHALINKMRLVHFDTAKGYMDFGQDGARVVPVDGCAQFSSRLCNYGLFYSHDFDKDTFGASANVLAVNDSLRKAGLVPVWLAIPDKATIYLGYGKLNAHPYVDVWREFARHGELTAPDLGAAFTQASRTMKDFYKPDDVHLSNNGYLYLGDLMTELLVKQLKASPQGNLVTPGTTPGKSHE